jgi:hypothetical protein
VTEERGLRQGRGDRAAVDHDEGLLRAGAREVHRLRDELLAGARLAVIRMVSSVGEIFESLSKMRCIPWLSATIGPKAEMVETAMRSGRAGSKSTSLSPMRSLVPASR